MRIEAASSKAKQSGDTMTTTTACLAKEVRNPTIDANRACSNGNGKKNKCNSNKEFRKTNKTTKKGSLCDECGQRKKLLQL